MLHYRYIIIKLLLLFVHVFFLLKLITKLININNKSILKMKIKSHRWLDSSTKLRSRIQIHTKKQN